MFQRFEDIVYKEPITVDDLKMVEKSVDNMSGTSWRLTSKTPQWVVNVHSTPCRKAAGTS
jgi:hypothetical protein